MTVRLFVSTDAEESCYPVYLSSNGVERRSSALRWIRLTNHSTGLSSWCHLANCSLSVTKNCHHLRSMPLQGFSLHNGHTTQEFDCPQVSVEDFDLRSAQIAVAGPVLIGMIAYCGGSQSAIVWAWSICPPYPDPCADFAIFLSRAVLHSSLGNSGVVQYGVADNWFCARGRPINGFSCPAVLLHYLDCTAYQQAGRGGLV